MFDSTLVGFMVQQLLFDLDLMAVDVTTKAANAILSHNSMARNKYGDRIVAAGITDGSCAGVKSFSKITIA